MFKDTKDILLALFVISFVAAAMLLFSFRATAKGSRLLAEEQLLKAQVSRDKARDELLREQQDKEGIKGNLDRLKNEALSLESELSKRRSRLDSVKLRLNETEKAISTASKGIEQTVLNIEEIRRRIANVVKDTLHLREELILLQKTKSALESRLQQYASRRKPESIIMGVEAEPRARPDSRMLETTESFTGEAFDGEVLTINREFDFIVVSLGKNDGVTEGMIFDVIRDGNVLGQVEIETVRSNISAASLINKEAIAVMRAGDRIQPAFASYGKAG